jgi:trans-aconitate 2-methyltransferase
MNWDPSQYLKYATERLRPALDLVARVSLVAPRTIVDLGCGAGNVTQILSERWPTARITGVDNSASMLAKAQDTLRGNPRVAWLEADLAAWAAAAPAGGADLVYSNAALHWLDLHEILFPRLLSAVADDGILAVQMPSNFHAPSHTVLEEVAAGPQWGSRLRPLLRPVPVASATQYFDWLAPHAQTIDAWTTEYLHVLAPAANREHPVVTWTKGTALTPFTAVLDAEEQRAFIAEYAARIATAYPPRPDGHVLFPFRRVFIVAMRAKR